MNNFQLFWIAVFLGFILFYFVIRPLVAIGDIPDSIDRLTREVKELKKVLENETKRKNNTKSV